MGTAGNVVHREPWNKGKLIGQKAPFKLKDIWVLRVRLQMKCRVREMALFNLGIISKLRGCDLVSLKVRSVCHGDQVVARAIVVQHKTQRPVQFEITSTARETNQAWIKLASDALTRHACLPCQPHIKTGSRYERFIYQEVAARSMASTQSSSFFRSLRTAEQRR